MEAIIENLLPTVRLLTPPPVEAVFRETVTLTILRQGRKANIPVVLGDGSTNGERTSI